LNKLEKLDFVFNAGLCTGVAGRVPAELGDSFPFLFCSRFFGMSRGSWKRLLSAGEVAQAL
jgi:hypothetical protein